MEDELKPLLPKSLNFVLLQLIILSLGVGLLESCSWVTSRRSLFGDDPKIEKEKKAKELKAKNEAFKKQGKSTEVPREEYEQLKNKYESLLNGDYDKSKLSDKPISQEEMGDVKDPAQLVEQLKTAPEVRSGSSGELAETVDVFGKNGIVRNSNTPSGPTSNALQKHETDFVSDSIESEITKLREAEGLIELNKFNEGLNKLKVVENST
ncbi:MAG: hypothetical protein ACJAT2_000971, partial [Bacteriovoracaceae bacterium]